MSASSKEVSTLRKSLRVLVARQGECGVPLAGLKAGLLTGEEQMRNFDPAVLAWVSITRDKVPPGVGAVRE